MALWISWHCWKSDRRPKQYSPRRARESATTRRRTSRTCPMRFVLTKLSKMKSFCCPWNLSTVDIAAGMPNNG